MNRYSSNIPKTGDDTITREERMASLSVPSPSTWSRMTMPGLGILALCSYYSFVIGLNDKKGPLGSDQPSASSIQNSLRFQGPPSKTPEVNPKDFGKSKIESEPIRYQPSKTSLSQILKGNKSLKLGDSSLLLHTVNLCFGKAPYSRDFTPKLSAVLSAYQIKKQIPSNGELNKDTLLALFKDGMLEERHGSLELGKEFFLKKRQIQTPKGRDSLVDNFIGKFSVPQASHILEARFHYDGINRYREFIKAALNDSKLKGWSDDHLKVRHLRDIETLLDAGFTQPLLIPSGLIGAVAETYKNPDKDRPLAVIFVGEDYNGAFYHGAFPEIINFLLENRFNIRFVSAYDKKDLSDLEKLSHYGLPSDKKSAFTVLAWHGEKDGFSLSSTSSESSYLKIGDKEIKKICGIIAPGSAVISYACSTAEGGRDKNNIVSHLALNCKAQFICGPQQSCNLQVTSEPEDPRFWTTVKFEAEGEPVTKLYLRYENPQFPEHMDKQVPAIVFRRNPNGSWRIPVRNAKK